MSSGGISPKGPQDPVTPIEVPVPGSPSASSASGSETERMSAATKPAMEENKEIKNSSSLKERVIRGKDSVKEYIMDRTILGMVIGGVNSAAKKIFGSSSKAEQEQPRGDALAKGAQAKPTGDDARSEGEPVKADAEIEPDPFMAHLFGPSKSHSAIEDGKPPAPPSKEGEEEITPPPTPPRDKLPPEPPPRGPEVAPRPAHTLPKPPPRDEVGVPPPPPDNDTNSPIAESKIIPREGAVDFSKFANDEENKT